MAASGFVYVLSNPAFPGVVKVGVTSKHPAERASELQTTGVPCPFKIEMAIYSEYAREIELAVHEHLSEKRVAMNREFFQVSCLDEATHCLIEAWLSFHSSGMVIAWEPYVVQDDEAALYSQRAKVHPVDLTSLLRFVADDEWQTLVERRRARRAETRESTNDQN